MKIGLNKIYFEEKDDIGYIILNDPPGNQMTSVLINEFIDIYNKFVLKSKVKGIIIAGKGRHFSSGANVDQLKDSIISQTVEGSDNYLLSYPVWFIENRNAFNSLVSLKIPVIAAVNGFCIGSGLELALASHIRVCGEGSVIGFPEATFGLLPGATGTLRSIETMGFGKALELVLNGEFITPEEGVNTGLFHKCTSKKATLSYCEGLMKFIISNVKQYSKEDAIFYIKEFDHIYNS